MLRTLLIVLISFLFVPQVAFSFDLCAGESIIHQPRADVTHNPSQVVVADPIIVPITIDIAERFDLDTTSGLGASPLIGVMEIYKDGRILYEGKDISGDIKEKCNDDTTSDQENERDDEQKQ